ncbi:hypothetical protein NKJ26_26695 [Mesorhizobium sp. M0152]|uniref:NAD(P)/FAD-dependent oxidoreductase n=1 Tax=Mesorhizobium sp. M0152 TaxID=2956898 RepID=UPI00333B0261
MASRAVLSAWAGEAQDERHSISPPRAPAGNSTDRLLVQAAAAAGAQVRVGCEVRSAEREGQGRRLNLADGDIVAGAVIWATGRSWRLARSFGAKLRVHGHLAAYTRFFDRAPGACRMVIEARPEGWWYSADLPGGRRMVACLTDPTGQRTARSAILVRRTGGDAINRPAPTPRRTRNLGVDQIGRNGHDRSGHG